MVASYGGFDDTIIDPFGFPLRLDLDTTIDFKRAVIKSDDYRVCDLSQGMTKNFRLQLLAKWPPHQVFRTKQSKTKLSKAKQSLRIMFSNESKTKESKPNQSGRRIRFSKQSKTKLSKAKQSKPKWPPHQVFKAK